MADDTAETQRVIGQLEGKQEATEQRLKSIEAKLDTLVEYMNTAKGGIGMLFKVGSAGAAIGTGISELFHYFRNGHL